MNNLTGVCLVRHHINAWEQIQATIIELDKFCDKIILFSHQQKFLNNFQDLKNSKIVIKFLPLSASNEAIEKYIFDCVKMTATEAVMYLEAGDCFHQRDVKAMHIDFLHLLEDKTINGIDFPICYIFNQSAKAFDRSLPQRQIRIFRKESISEFNFETGFQSQLAKKDLFILPSSNRLFSYGSRAKSSVLTKSKLRDEHPLVIKQWIDETEEEFFEERKKGLTYSLSYAGLILEKLTGKRVFQPKKYKHISH